MKVEKLKKILNIKLELPGEEAEVLLNVLKFCSRRFLVRERNLGVECGDMLRCCEVLVTALNNALEEGMKENDK